MEKFSLQIRAKYEIETGDTWTNSQGEPDINYVEWLENKINAYETLGVFPRKKALKQENASNSAPSDEALLLAEHNPMNIQPKDFWVKKPIKDLNDKSLKEGDYVKYDFELYVFKCWGYDSVILIDMKGNEKEIPWY